MHGRFLLALLFTASAWAQSQPPTNTFGSDCAYPEGARSGSVTVLTFQIGPDDQIHDVRVLRGSGSQELDDAGVRCVAGWRATTAPEWKVILDAGRIAINWSYLPDHPEDAVGKPSDGFVYQAHVCDNYPEITRRLKIEGTTVVGYRITTSGNVADPHVLNSSGDERLDDAALACVVNWWYRPVTKNGKPIEVAWITEVKWTVRKTILERLFD